MIDHERCCRVLLFGEEETCPYDGTSVIRESAFLYFYGLNRSDLMTIPNEYIRSALKKRPWLAKYSASPLYVENVRPKRNSPLIDIALGRRS